MLHAETPSPYTIITSDLQMFGISLLNSNKDPTSGKFTYHPILLLCSFTAESKTLGPVVVGLCLLFEMNLAHSSF